MGGIGLSPVGLGASGVSLRPEATSLLARGATQSYVRCMTVAIGPCRCGYRNAHDIYAPKGSLPLSCITVATEVRLREDSCRLVWPPSHGAQRLIMTL